MGLRSHVSGAKATAPATEAPVASVKEENTKEKAAAMSSVAVEQPSNGNLGIKSDKIAFVCPLGDPSRPDITAYTDPVTKEQKKRSDPTIVGYVFKALEDMEVPDCGLGDDFKTNRMSYVNPAGKKAVKAGEEFDVTPFEVGMLLSPEEYNAKATGGDMKVMLTYAFAAKKTASGEIQKTSAGTKVPNVTVKAMEKNESIKNVKMREVLTVTTTMNENGQKRMTRTINPGYEKYAVLCKTAPRRASAGTRDGAVKKAERNRGAQGFMEAIQKITAKKAQ